MNSREELAAFLGESNYEARKMLWTPQLENEALRGVEFPSVQAFQDTKESLYLYTVREWAEWWIPHMEYIRDRIAPPATVLDYHAATGWIGLAMRPGLQVHHADYQTRCLDFLRWRLKSRGGNGEVYNLEDGAPPQVFDAVVAIDAVWRYKDPMGFIDNLAQFGLILVLDLDSRLVYDIGKVLAHVSERYKVIDHKTVNHYVNLVAIRTGTSIDTIAAKAKGRDTKKKRSLEDGS